MCAVERVFGTVRALRSHAAVVAETRQRPAAGCGDLRKQSYSCVMPDVTCCPPAADGPSLAAALACFKARTSPELPGWGGMAVPTASAQSTGVHALAVGLHCMNSTTVESRGFFVVARRQSTFHLRAVERSAALHYSSMSVAVLGAGLFAYWMSTRPLLLPGTHAYRLRLALVETRSESEPLGDLDLRGWLRSHQCEWAPVPLPFDHVWVTSPSLTQEEPLCGPTLPPAADFAFVELAEGKCGRWCVGNATSRLDDTANRARRLARAKQGFRHRVLKPLGCRLRLRGEERLAKCLRGRSVLLTGSTYNVDLRKGLARLNSTTGAWTRQSPGPLHPNVADFWRAFEKPSGQYCYRRGACRITFGRSVVSSNLFHYPSFGGLANLKARHYEDMCRHDVRRHTWHELARFHCCTLRVPTPQQPPSRPLCVCM